MKTGRTKDYFTLRLGMNGTVKQYFTFLAKKAMSAFREMDSNKRLHIF